MPEPDIIAELTSISIEWGAARLSGEARVRLTSEAVVVETRTGSWQARWSELRGGTWRRGAITINGSQGIAVLESSQGLDDVWVALINRVCPLPELASGHRLLGSRRGGRVDLQAGLLTPLVQARRRVADEVDLEARVATLNARVLRERLTSALQSIAREAFPASDPDRRGLEAELEEATARLFVQIDAMEAAADSFRKAPDAARFAAWRDWVFTLQNVYALADASWATAARLLPGPISR